MSVYERNLPWDIMLFRPDTAPKRHWSIINTFLNNKKIPIIPPVIFKGKLISDFKKKAELFNYHFVSQYALVKNESTLPNLEYKTHEKLNYFDINKNEILSENKKSKCK